MAEEQGSQGNRCRKTVEILRLLPDEDISLKHCRYLSEKQMIQMHIFP